MKAIICLALISVCLVFAMAAKKGEKKEKHMCRYDSHRGYIKTFFDKEEGINTPMFPCKYLMADFNCGGIRARVTVKNDAIGPDEHYKIITRTLAVELKYRVDGEVYRQTMKLNRDAIDEFKKKKDVSKLWESKFEGGEPENKDIAVQAQYNKKKGITFIETGDLQVIHQLEPDVTVITCANGMVEESRNFPNTVCGNPDDPKKALEDIFPAFNKVEDVNFARWDMVFLSRQDEAKQYEKNTLCLAAKEAVEDENCKSRPDATIECHRLYNLFEAGYGQCMRKTGIHPLKAYTICMKTLCYDDSVQKGKKKAKPFKLSEEECKLMHKVAENCVFKKATLQISDILAKGMCIEE